MNDLRQQPQPPAPLNPQQDQRQQGQRQQGNKPGSKPTKLPESVALMLGLFSAAVFFELCHHILSVVMGIMDPAPLKAQARESLKNGGPFGGGDAVPSEGMLNASVTTAIVMAGLVGIAFLVLLLVMIQMVRKKHKRADIARRILFVFGVYFGLRAMMIFGAHPQGSTLPVWLYALDGSLQILVGVAAVTGVVFSLREDTLKFTGELGKGPGGFGSFGPKPKA